MAGVVLLAMAFGLAVLAFVMPYTAEVVRPLPPGYEYVGGLPPKVTVQCGSLLAPEDPAYPAGTKYLTAESPAVVAAACRDERPNLWAMGIASGSVGLLLLAAIVASTLRTRRSAGRTSVMTPV